jgi:GTP-binding protein
MAQRGPSSKLGKRARIYYATQPAANPPTIVLFVNDPDIFGEQYQRYMINCFRETLPFEEVPIKLAIRGRKRRDMQRDEQPIAEG